MLWVTLSWPVGFTGKDPGKGTLSVCGSWEDVRRKAIRQVVRPRGNRKGEGKNMDGRKEYGWKISGWNAENRATDGRADFEVGCCP